MVPAKVLDEVERFLGYERIARIEEGRIVMLDCDEPLQMFVPPPSLLGADPVSRGLQYLRTEKPAVTLLLSMHYDRSDFQRLAEYNGHILDGCTVVGVEAFCIEGNVSRKAVPRPQLTTVNPRLLAFQQAQFAWMDKHGIVMLPCEPNWPAELAERLDRLDKLTISLRRGDARGYSPEAQRTLLHPLYVYGSIFRTWGLIGQFGYWLSRPAVQELVEAKAPIPFILGSGNGTTRCILQEYCGLDVTACITDRAVPGWSHDQTTFWQIFGQEVERQGMALADLELLVPL